jgi:hypothetical protein
LRACDPTNSRNTGAAALIPRPLLPITWRRGALPDLGLAQYTHLADDVFWIQRIICSFGRSCQGFVLTYPNIIWQGTPSPRYWEKGPGDEGRGAGSDCICWIRRHAVPKGRLRCAPLRRSFLPLIRHPFLTASPRLCRPYPHRLCRRGTRSNTDSCRAHPV